MTDVELDNAVYHTAKAFTFPQPSPNSPGASSFYTADWEDDVDDRLSIHSCQQSSPRLPLSRYNSFHSTPSPTLPTFSTSPIESAVAISISHPGSPRLIDIPPSPRSSRGHHPTLSSVSETPPSLVSGSSEDEGPEEDIPEPLPVIPRRSSLRRVMTLGMDGSKDSRSRKKLVKKGTDISQCFACNTSNATETLPYSLLLDPSACCLPLLSNIFFRGIKILASH